MAGGMGDSRGGGLVGWDDDGVPTKNVSASPLISLVVPFVVEALPLGVSGLSVTPGAATTPAHVLVDHAEAQRRDHLGREPRGRHGQHAWVVWQGRVGLQCRLPTENSRW